MLVSVMNFISSGVSFLSCCGLQRGLVLWTTVMMCRVVRGSGRFYVVSPDSRDVFKYK